MSTNLNEDPKALIELIKGRTIKDVLLDEKYIRLELDDEIKFEIEVELPVNGSCKMGVYASQVKRNRVWI